ncbi:hypothetical protein CN918_27220 [Priestia megaterium]|nr:hypothetical protein CN918_27220 [Priestia megaterium]
MRTLSSILSDIDSIYPEYKQLEKELASCKKSLKRYYDNSSSSYKNQPLIQQGIRLHYKKKTKKTWHLNQLHEELSQLNMMHMAKKITKHHLSFITPSPSHLPPSPNENTFSSFLYPTEQYVRPYVKRKAPHIVEEEKKYLSELEDQIAELPLHEILSLYHGYNTSYTQLDTLYDSLRHELQEHMIASNTFELKNTVGTWKIVSRTENYDLCAMEQESYIKKIYYSFFLQDNQLMVHDNFSKESKPLLTDTLTLNEHILNWNNDGLYIDGFFISSFTKTTIMRRLQANLSPNEPFAIHGCIPLSGKKLMRQLPVSNTKIDNMISRGFLHPSILNDMRYIETSDDISTYFEVIEETAHNKRMEVFMKANMNRAQTLRYMNENAKEVLKTLTT